VKTDKHFLSKQDKSKVCDHFSLCGGCKLFESPYPEQLLIKQERVKKEFQRFDCIIDPIIASPLRFHYRNKVEMTFFEDDHGDVGLGFHEKGEYDRFVNVRQCLLSPAENGELLREVRHWANSNRYPAYQKRGHYGLLRYLIIRDSFLDKNKLLILVTRERSLELASSLALALKDKFNIAGVIGSDQPEVADAVLLTHRQLAHGQDYLFDQIGHCRFKIPANSFFQVNTSAATLLYDQIRSCIKPGDNVLDLFCGAGTIGCYIADVASSVFGIEMVESAILSATENTKLNKVTNLSFTSGRVRERLANLYFVGSGEDQRLRDDAPHFDTIILDPPRSGTDKKTCRRVAALKPRQIIYVACGFENMAYNLRSFIDAGYRIARVIPFDFFPNTPHVEVFIQML
jgi:23S rRNA (uracil1939-C5)-methyltransferase